MAPSIRPPAHAGTFYPSDAAALASMVDRCVAEAPVLAVTPKALVAPHAGYVYSGPIAGTAYRSIAKRQGTIRRVVLLGPCHWVPTRKFAVPSAKALATPLGEMPVDVAGIETLAAMEGVEVDDEPHAQEHSLEVHLPFLQRVLGDVAVLPIAVGTPSVAETAAVLDRVWGGEETLIVASSDLSHYHDYAGARRLDIAASRAIETLRIDELGDEQACGRYPVRGLMAQAAARDLRVTTLDLRSSGDTAGRDRRDRVVGYGAYGFEPASAARLSPEDRHTLVREAYRALFGALEGRPATADRVEQAPVALRAQRATFVTLTLGDQLRGCIGSLSPQEPLIASVTRNAARAALEDPRFERPTRDEARRMTLTVSILSHPRPMPSATEGETCAALRPGTDGVILQVGERRGLFLPEVWESLPEPRTFLAHLKQKAGLDPEGWPEGIRLFRFRTERFWGRLQPSAEARDG